MCKTVLPREQFKPGENASLWEEGKTGNFGVLLGKKWFSFVYFVYILPRNWPFFFYLSVSMNRPMCISFVAKVELLDATFFSEYRQKLFLLSKEFKNSLLASNSSTVHHSVPWRPNIPTFKQAKHTFECRGLAGLKTGLPV